jgi:osmotically-inducible protein OsmY
MAVLKEVTMMGKRYVAIRRAGIYGLAAILLSVLAAACAATSTTESTGGYIDDVAITTKVKSTLAADPQLRNPLQTPLQIRVETYKGVVQLSGFVNSPDTVQRAAVDASEVAGVKQVVNNLIVKTAASGASG